MCVACLVLILHNVTVLIFAIERRQGLLKLTDHFGKVFKENLVHLYRDTNGSDTFARFTFEMNGIQVLMSCCGVHDYKDYAEAELWKTDLGENSTVPPTCCHLNQDIFLFQNMIMFQNESCEENPTSKNSYIQKGCLDLILFTIRQRIFYSSLSWQCLSTLLYIICLILFIYQIRYTGKQEDPFAELRDGRFLDETQHVVQQLCLDEKETEKAAEAKEEDDKELVEEHNPGLNILNVVLNMSRKNLGSASTASNTPPTHSTATVPSPNHSIPQSLDRKSV
ncbi:hypothetical protein ACOMHN_007721 [Nucella lapillus]